MDLIQEGDSFVADNSETETKHGHCERGRCSTEGQLFLIELDMFDADPKRGVAEGRRWYCAECQQRLITSLVNSGAIANATPISTENLDTGVVRIPVAGPTRVQ